MANQFTVPPFADGGTKTEKWKVALVDLSDLHNDIELGENYGWMLGDLVAGVDRLNEAIREMLVERNGEALLWKKAWEEMQGLYLRERGVDRNNLKALEDIEWTVDVGELAKRTMMQTYKREQREEKADAASG